MVELCRMKRRRILSTNLKCSFISTDSIQVTLDLSTNIFRLKGTVRVISSDPPLKYGNARFTTVPLKPLFI